MPRLTKRAVDALQKRAGGDTFLWDSELRGFRVHLKPSNTKTFVIQYRNAERRTRRFVIGLYGVLTIEVARDLAKKKLASVVDGGDPSQERRAAREGMAVAEVCDWYLEEADAWRRHGRNKRPIKVSSVAGDHSRIEQHIKPLIGTRVVSHLKRADTERLQADIAGGKSAHQRRLGRGGQTSDGAGVAGRAISTLRSLFNHARRLGIIDQSPANGVRVIASQKLKRRLSLGEVHHLGKIMSQMEREGEHPTGLAAIRLMVLTGFRRMGVLAMRKDWIESDENRVGFPDTKSGPQMRAAGDAAISHLLAQGQRRASPYVFPADWGDGHFIGVVRVLERVFVRAELTKVTPHVLRHTFATIAGSLGYRERIIAGLLGHGPRGVTQRHVHLDAALVIAADPVSAEIARLLEGGEVRSMKEAKRLRFVDRTRLFEDA